MYRLKHFIRQRFDRRSGHENKKPKNKKNLKKQISI